MGKNKIAYILIIISVIIIIAGTIIFLTGSNPKDKEKSDKEKQEKTPEEIIELEKNDSLNEEHCLENICLNNMEITGNYHEYFNASVDITNKSNATIENKYIKVLFEVEGNTQIKYWYIEKLEINETINIVVGLTDDTLLKATSYQLEKPTAKEIAEQDALLVD